MAQSLGSALKTATAPQGRRQCGTCRCVHRWLRAHCRGRRASQSTRGGLEGDQSLPTSEQVWALRLDIRTTSQLSFAANEEHSTLLSRILSVRDLQCAWFLLLFCAAARANYLLRVLPPSQSETFATVHDSSVWNDVGQSRAVPDKRRVGLAERNEASWADALPTIRERHPSIDQFCLALQRGD